MLASLVEGAVLASPVVVAAVGISQLQSAELHGPDGAAGPALAVRTGVASNTVRISMVPASIGEAERSASVGVGASMLLASAIPPPLKAAIKTTQQRAITVFMQRVTPHNCGQHGAVAVASKDALTWLSKRDAKSTVGFVGEF
jgi:hypothetical protein